LELNYHSLLVAVVRSAPVRQRGVVEFAARRVKEIGGDAIIVQRSGRLYVGTYSSGSAFTLAAQPLARAFTTYDSDCATTNARRTRIPFFAGNASVADH
jgi:hypothetical protein